MKNNFAAEIFVLKSKILIFGNYKKKNNFFQERFLILENSFFAANCTNY